MADDVHAGCDERGRGGRGAHSIRRLGKVQGEVLRLRLIVKTSSRFHSALIAPDIGVRSRSDQDVFVQCELPSRAQLRDAA